MFNCSRLEKRIYIPLPELNERTQMFKKHLEGDIPHTIKPDEWVQLGQKAEQLVSNMIDSNQFSVIFSYSGADIGVVCREALLRPIRRLLSATHFKQVRTKINISLTHYDHIAFV